MDIPEWIMQPRPPSRPTEIFVPVRVGVTPVSYYDGRGDGWQGEVYVELLDEYAGATCPHSHPDQDEAWTCAEALAARAAADLLGAQIAQPVAAGKGRQPGRVDGGDA